MEIFCKYKTKYLKKKFIIYIHMHASKYRDMRQTNRIFQRLQNQGSSQSRHSKSKARPGIYRSFTAPKLHELVGSLDMILGPKSRFRNSDCSPKSSQSTNSTVHHPIHHDFFPLLLTLCDEIFRMDTPISSDVFCHDDIVILLQSHLQITTHKLVGHWPKILNWLVPQKTWCQQHLNTPLVLLMAWLIELRKPDFGNPTGPQPLYV